MGRLRRATEKRCGLGFEWLEQRVNVVRDVTVKKQQKEWMDCRSDFSCIYLVNKISYLLILLVKNLRIAPTKPCLLNQLK